MLSDINIHSQLIPPPAQDVKNSASSILIVEKPEIHQTNGKINRVPTSQVFQHRTKLKTLAETASQEQEVQSQHYQRATTRTKQLPQQGLEAGLPIPSIQQNDM